MSGRTIILILFFWAVLSIVTPVLVRLSATAKANGEFFVKHTSDLKEKTNAGKVIGLLPRRALVAVAPPLAPVPGPSPWPTDTRTTRLWEMKITTRKLLIPDECPIGKGFPTEKPWETLLTSQILTDSVRKSHRKLTIFL